MTTVAERHDAVLAEQARFAQGRGATSPQWLRDLQLAGSLDLPRWVSRR